MSEPKWTAGKWRFLEARDHEGPWNASHALTICSEGYDDLASIFSSHDSTVNIPREQAVANAHLIASAPTLYAALEHALRHMTDVENAMGETIADIFSGYDSSALDEARAAMAAARGEGT